MMPLVALALILPAGCEQGRRSVQWSVNDDDVQFVMVEDTANDFSPDELGAPSYATVYPPVDIATFEIGVDSEYLYVRVQFNSIIPTAKYPVAAEGAVEAQSVHQHDVTINLDTDDNTATGAGQEGIGVDLLIGILFKYGEETAIYANYGFSNNDVHLNSGHVEGTVGEGGQGTDYVVGRLKLSELEGLFVRGRTVPVVAWSEAESNLYHHYAIDRLTPFTWLVPGT